VDGTMQKSKPSKSSTYCDYATIQALINNPKATVNDLLEAISENHDLCSRLIKLANSVRAINPLF
jgi:hypothetical protein